MRPQLPLVVSLARRIHRALLVLAPRAVRRAYRAEMIATFDAASADAGARGLVALIGLLVREAADLVRARMHRNAVPRLVTSAVSGRTVLPHDAREWLRFPAWRQAWRSLRRRPAFLAAAVVTLGFGTGVTTAVFSLVDTVLIKPLPYPDADRLVTVFETSPSAREGTSLIAPARLADWQRLTTRFVAIAGNYAENVTDTSGDAPERLEGRRVTPRFFDVYATPPAIGRTFVTTEEQASGPGAVVISDRLWARRFQRSADVLGRALTIAGRPHVIVGVMPATFTAAPIDVWLPAQFAPRLLELRDARFLSGIGRLKAGVGIDEGGRELVAVQQALARDFPKTDAGWSAEIRSLKEARIGDARRGLVLVLGAVASLWLIAVANIAGLTLVQVHRRARELAIRSALGGSRARVLGTVIREGVIVAAIGGAIGAGLAAWIVSAMPAVLDRTPRVNELAFDWRALAFLAATSLLAACAFSLVPAIAGTRAKVASVIGRAGRTVATGRHPLQATLVLAQVALSLLLVGSATLLLRSYYNLTRVEMGVDASDTITFHVGAGWGENRGRVGELQQQLLARLEELPHVSAAGYTNFLPASGATLRHRVLVDGLAGTNADGSMTIGARMIGGSYLRAIGAPLVAGSLCPALKTDFDAPGSVLVNQRFVDTHAAGQAVIGRQLRVVQQSSTPHTIVGVIGNIAEDSQATSPVPYAYTCDSAGMWPDPEYVARTTDARAFAADLRRIVRELDPARAVFGQRPLQELLDSALDQPRLDTAVLVSFAASAVTLAAIGLYSLFMLIVADRAREMAVRLAIGASPREVMHMVLAGAGRLIALGILLGVVLTAAADRVLRGVLFGVKPLDATALAASAAILALVATVAVIGPARRASRIAPIDALRGD